jgi:hypothetical protein
MMKFSSLLIVLPLLMASTFDGYGQSGSQSEPAVRKNDILIDPIYLIALPVLNLSYERLLNADVGIGAHGLFGLEGIGGFSQVSPYARMYFGERYASGFFLEAFVPITTSEETLSQYDYNTGNYIENTGARYTTAGIGVGLGGKWILKKNILFELGGGIARRFAYQGDGEPITGKWMLGVGYRF